MPSSSETHWIAEGVLFSASTIPPRHHFFGYYEKCPWDENNRDILAMESTFADRMPTANDPLFVGLIPHGTKRFEAFDKLSRGAGSKAPCCNGCRKTGAQ